MKIKVYVQTNKIGSLCEDEFELDDNISESEIEDQARECMFNMIEWSWSKEKKD